MRKTLIGLFVVTVFLLQAQNTMFRSFPQTYGFGGFFNCEAQNPVKTIDNGYVLSFLPWSPNLHTVYPIAFITIKTDSNFVPQWQKPLYSKAIALPTGGIILIYNLSVTNNLYNGMCIEKITQSGVQVWNKIYTNENIVLNDGVLYGDTVRFVGRKRGNTGWFSYAETSQAYTMEMDTSGNFISQTLFNNSLGVNADFSRVKRDQQGNFYVYSVSDPFSSSRLSLAKFDPAFNFIWAKASPTFNPISITDIDFLSSGSVFATVRAGAVGVFAKFDSQGNILADSYFINRNTLSGLLKKPNGNYVISSSKYYNQGGDSLFLFETDTLMNVAWYKWAGRGTVTTASILKNNSIYTPMFYDKNPFIFSNDTNGTSCMSYSISRSQATASLQLSNFTFTPTTSTAALTTFTFDVINSQNYVDSCGCNAFVNISSQSFCLPNVTATVSATSNGNLSWYSSPTGPSLIGSGSQYTFSSNTASLYTFYVQDSTCAQNPIRTPVYVSVYAPPTLTLSPASPSVCIGNNIFIFANGAVNYTWTRSPSPNWVANGPVINANPLVNTIYTVTGSVAPNCSDTKTVSLTIMPLPTLTTGPSVTACIGSPVTLTVSGANTYTWSNWTVGNSNTVTPYFALSYYNVSGNNGFCSSIAVATVVGVPMLNPTLSSTPGVLCIGNTATINVSGVNTYSWVGHPLNNNMPLVVTPTVSSTFTLTSSTSSNCVGGATLNLVVAQNPTVNVIASTPTVCLGTPATFTASGANTYSWNNAAGSSIFIASPTTNTVYSLTGKDANNCMATQTVAINVLPLPNITISLSDNMVCEGDTVVMSAAGANTYSWSNLYAGASHTAAISSTTNYTVTGIDGNNCINNASVTILTEPYPTLSIVSSSTIVCLGNAVSLVANGANTYTWNNISTGSTLSTMPLANTIYTVNGLSAFNCAANATVGINVLSIPSVSVVSSTPSLCAGLAVTVTASGADSYVWNTGANTTTLVINPTTSGFVTAVGTDSNNCSNADSVYVSVLPLPIITVSYASESICAGQASFLSASGASSYSWSTQSNDATIFITPTVSTSFTISGTAQNGCQNTTVFTQLVDNCVGILDSKSENAELLVFPNPTRGRFKITTNTYEDLTLTIANALGQQILCKKLMDEVTEISLDDCAPGIYFIHVQGNKKSKIVKIVKQ